MDSLLELIKTKSYDKRMDEFKQNECVICFEDFVKGVNIKKIPICKHIFHSVCLDNWLKSRLQENSHKCPLCNAEITEDKIKEALKQKREDRKNMKLNAVAPMSFVIDKGNASPGRRNQRDQIQQPVVY